MIRPAEFLEPWNPLKTLGICSSDFGRIASSGECREWSYRGESNWILLLSETLPLEIDDPAVCLIWYWFVCTNSQGLISPDVTLVSHGLGKNKCLTPHGIGKLLGNNVWKW